MTDIIITVLVCASALIGVIYICNTALSIAKVNRVVTDSEMKSIQKELDKEYEEHEKTMLNLNNVLEALDDEYGKDDED